MKHFSRFEIREESKTNYLRFSKNTSSLVARPFCDSILVIWKTFLFHTISRWVPMKPIQVETIETIFFVCTKREDLLSLKTTFKKYIRSRFLSFDPSPPLLFVLVRFWAPTSRSTLKLHFENLSIFLKKRTWHLPLPSPPLRTYFLNDP